MQGSQPHARGAAMERPQKAEPAPELAKLGSLVGTWSGTAELASPVPDELQGLMPSGVLGAPSRFQGGGTFEWVLGGMFLKGEGWHEMGGGRQVRYTEYITWDAKAEKFRNWWFGDTGEHGQGWMSFDSDGKTIRAKSEGLSAQGVPVRRERTMTLVDDKTMDWSWLRETSRGKMELKGTSHRER